jgi:hypothetical protein
MGVVLMGLHSALTRSHQLHDDPGHAVALCTFQLCEAIKDLEVMSKDPLAGRHVAADRVTLQRMAIRLVRIAQTGD